MNILRWHIGNLHVSLSDRKVLRDVYDLMKKHPANMTLANKPARKEMYRAALDYHHENQDLYHDVMTGRI